PGAAERLDAEIGRELGHAIDAHVASDHAAADQTAGAGAEPACLDGRRQVLAARPHVTVVIATKDRAESLATAMASVLANEYPSFDVVVVDNASRTDE